MKLILTNVFGAIEITSATSRADAEDYMAGVDKRAGLNNRIASAVLLHPDNSVETIRTAQNAEHAALVAVAETVAWAIKASKFTGHSPERRLMEIIPALEHRLANLAAVRKGGAK